MRKYPSKRVVRSRNSLFFALVEMINEDDYNLSIRATDLCNKAKKGRTTFFRQYRQVGDIFRFKDEELLHKFAKLKIKGLAEVRIWRIFLMFIVKNREVFRFKFRYDKDKVFRAMVTSIIEEIKPGYSKNAQELEILYFEIRGIVKLWVDDGAKIDELEWVASCLMHATSNIERSWGAVFSGRDP